MEQTRALLCFCAWTQYTSLLFTSENWSKNRAQTLYPPVEVGMHNQFTKRLLLATYQLLLAFYIGSWIVRCKEYWKERLNAERAEMVRQSKQYWESRTRITLGYQQQQRYSRVTEESWSSWWSQDFLLGKTDNNSCLLIFLLII